ncbi:hypothetical protein CTI12_AA213720 [Artemisia annua]|uniref:CCHC-type domain-containing protein n=1 Tax=Artemisia annua TaxID=35608 RepID=A0A2U1NYF1_ARTAN|nr:hypothetical protein CTI12_AA213720 [Artemisia annua]
MADQPPQGRGRGRGPVTRRGARAMGIGHPNDDINAHDPRDIEIERLQQRVQELELQQEILQDSPAEETLSNPSVWHDGDVEFNPFGGLPKGHRDGKFRDDPLCGIGMKVEIPEFAGKSHPDDFIEWLSTVERIFDLKDIPDHLKVINEFDRLRMRCDVVEEEEQVIARFLGILKPEISDVVQLQPYWTYADVCHLALKVEKQLKNQVRMTGSRFTPTNHAATPVGTKTQTTKATGPVSTVTNSSSRTPRCYKCQGLGHVMRDCPNQQMVTLVEEDSEPAPKYYSDGDELVYEDEEVILPDVGELLIIQRALNADASKTDNDSCHSFRTALYGLSMVGSFSVISINEYPRTNLAFEPTPAVFETNTVCYLFHTRICLFRSLRSGQNVALERPNSLYHFKLSSMMKVLPRESRLAIFETLAHDYLGSEKNPSSPIQYRFSYTARIERLLRLDRTMRNDPKEKW